MLGEHFRIEGHKTWFETIEEMQAVLDDYLIGCNTRRPHQGRGMNGRTPLKAFVAGIPRPPRQEGSHPDAVSRLTMPTEGHCQPITP